MNLTDNMPTKKLPLSFARSLKQMMEGEKLTAGTFRNKTILNRFIHDGVIKRVALNKRGSKYYIDNTEFLNGYLQSNWSIKSIDNYIELFTSKRVDGEQSLNATNSSKTKRNSLFSGFFIKSNQPELVQINNRCISFIEGTELFVSSPEMLTIPDDAVVVGIENSECFLKIERLMYLFDSNKTYLFVMRYMSRGLVNWLNSCTNSYIHFGDFDPAGIAIYINEVKNKIENRSRCSFLVPKNIRNMVRDQGQTVLYDDQIRLLKNINIEEHLEVKPLLEILNSSGKGLEQEVFLEP